MNSKNRSNYFIALAVIACSAVLLAALSYALSGYSWRSGGRTLQIDFRDSTGIRPHSAVRYAGAIAGTVRQVRYLTPQERQAARDKKAAVRVVVELNPDVPPIPSNVQATLAAETLLGEKFIALSSDDPDAPPLAPGAVIQGGSVVAFDALARSAQAAIENVNGLLVRLRTDYPSLVPRIEELLGQGQDLLLQGSNVVHHADGAITNASDWVAGFRADYGSLIQKLDVLLDDGKSVSKQADRTLGRIDAFAQRADSLVRTNEANLHEILAELRVVSQNLKVVSTYAKALTASLGERPSRLIWSFKKTALPSEKKILQSTNPLPIEPSNR